MRALRDGQTAPAGLFADRPTATSYLLQRSRAPQWLRDLEQRYRVDREPELFRKRWTFEALSLLGTLFTLGCGVLSWIWIGAPQGISWMVSSMVEAAAYLAVVRGRVRTVSNIVLPIITLASIGNAYSGLSTSVAALCGIMAVLLICAMAETFARTVFFSVTSLIGLLVMYSYGAPASEPNRDQNMVSSISFVITCAMITGVGSWAWRRLQAETQAALEHNAALNSHLTHANAELESRVAQRTAELHELSVRDELTGLYNRRYLMNLTIGPRRRTPAGLLMIDIDHFKQINDTCGHAGGDEVLRRVAAELRGAMRADDVVARIGGEEFAVLLPAALPQECVGLAERLRRAVEDLQWPDHPIPAGRTTISVGIADCPDWATADFADMLRVADHALYQAKATGRNRVCVSNDAAVVASDSSR